MPRRDPGSYLVIARRVPAGGFVAWVMRASSVEGALEGAHDNQLRQGAPGITLKPYAVYDAIDRLVWGGAGDAPPSFLPRSARKP